MTTIVGDLYELPGPNSSVNGIQILTECSRCSSQVEWFCVRVFVFGVWFCPSVLVCVCALVLGCDGWEREMVKK